MIKLIFVSGTSTGDRYEVSADITIGRDPSNEVVIADPSVSLVHTQIYFENGIAIVKDLGSTNGTSVNGKRIISAHLCDGDALVIGKNRMLVEISGNDGGGSVATVMQAMPLPDESEDLSDDEAGKQVQTRRELSGNVFGSVTYYFKRKIADGGMGSVYEAEQFGAEGFIKKVAIKTILPEYIKSKQFVTSFVGEAKLVANLVHQNIVQIHHLGRHEDGYYIAMEYIDGVNLTTFLNKHRTLNERVPVDLATYIVSRISRGLEYAHNKKDDNGNSLGLVHRDVSPNNIMITREGEVKLTDFGVAKAKTFMEDEENYLVGSVEYMSPEQAECSIVDGRSDLFSLGLVYYELLTGIRVFQCEGDDVDGTVARVKTAVIPDPDHFRKGLPDSVVSIMMKCLQKNTRNRYQSAGEVSHDLEVEMYSKGYGPTIVSLAQYLKDMRLIKPV